MLRLSLAGSGRGEMSPGGKTAAAESFRTTRAPATRRESVPSVQVLSVEPPAFTNVLHVH